MADNNGCLVCGQDPLQSDGCRVAVIYVEDEKYVRIPFFGDLGERCHDCNALSGHYHHWGCDAEICPVCRGQLIGCDCMDVECPVITNKRSGRKATNYSQRYNLIIKKVPHWGKQMWYFLYVSVRDKYWCV